MPRWIIALVAAVIVVFAGGAALACSCLRFATPEAHLAVADVVFVGRVIESEGPTRGQRVTRFENIETLKGDGLAGEIAIAHTGGDQSAACGLEFPRGRDVLVFASRVEDGRLYTNACMAARFPIADYRNAIN